MGWEIGRQKNYDDGGGGETTTVYVIYVELRSPGAGEKNPDNGGGETPTAAGAGEKP